MIIAGTIIGMLLVTAAVLIYFNAIKAPIIEPKPGIRSVPKPAHWEAVADTEPHPDGNTFWRVRWSEQDASGKWFYCRHYGGNSPLWNRHAAESDAERMNKANEKPWAMSPHWKSKKV